MGRQFYITLDTVRQILADHKSRGSLAFPSARIDIEDLEALYLDWVRLDAFWRETMQRKYHETNPNLPAKPILEEVVHIEVAPGDSVEWSKRPTLPALYCTKTSPMSDKHVQPGQRWVHMEVEHVLEPADIHGRNYTIRVCRNCGHRW